MAQVVKKASCMQCYAKQQSAIPANLIFLVLLQDAELRSGQVAGLAEVPDLLLHKHEPLKAEEPVVLVGVPCVDMLVEFACKPARAQARSLFNSSMPAITHCKDSIIFGDKDSISSKDSVMSMQLVRPWQC